MWWDKTAAADFDHYNIYLHKAEIADVTGMRAVQQVKDIAISRYQATGLDDGTRYYIAVTAVDKSGNEGVKVTSVGATPTQMLRGTKDRELGVEIYNPAKAWAGTTLLGLNYPPPGVGEGLPQKPRIVEVNMLGQIVWEFLAPQRGFLEAELLPNDNILYTSAGNGVFEIDRSGKIVWQYLTSRADHDADRLPNGNTIFVCASDKTKNDAQVTEVNSKGEVVWTWYARDYFDRLPYSDIISTEGDWTHTNAVSRLLNGNTLISLRDFQFVVEVNPRGEVVRTIGEGILDDPHEPEIIPNGNLLVASQNTGLPQNKGKPQSAIEIDVKTGKVVWRFRVPVQLVRDANRLPNGNTLITGNSKIIEVTPDGEVVWQFALHGINVAKTASGFYKADRISTQK
ncbi:MAG: hypothetical protein EXR47_01515 [Dehalococcoidia bacterium]|nr:hypothetical protein [Dehalococcoidia bacterium]